MSEAPVFSLIMWGLVCGLFFKYQICSNVCSWSVFIEVEGASDVGASFRGASRGSESFNLIIAHFAPPSRLCQTGGAWLAQTGVFWRNLIMGYWGGRVDLWRKTSKNMLRMLVMEIILPLLESISFWSFPNGSLPPCWGRIKKICFCHLVEEPKRARE